jgi:hypothetical protein
MLDVTDHPVCAFLTLLMAQPPLLEEEGKLLLTINGTPHYSSVEYQQEHTWPTTNPRSCKEPLI